MSTDCVSAGEPDFTPVTCTSPDIASWFWQCHYDTEDTPFPRGIERWKNTRYFRRVIRVLATDEQQAREELLAHYLFPGSRPARFIRLVRVERYGAHGWEGEALSDRPWLLPDGRPKPARERFSRRNRATVETANAGPND